MANHQITDDEYLGWLWTIRSQRDTARRDPGFPVRAADFKRRTGCLPADYSVMPPARFEAACGFAYAGLVRLVYGLPLVEPQ